MKLMKWTTNWLCNTCLHFLFLHNRCFTKLFCQQMKALCPSCASKSKAYASYDLWPLGLIFHYVVFVFSWNLFCINQPEDRAIVQLRSVRQPTVCYMNKMWRIKTARSHLSKPCDWLWQLMVWSTIKEAVVLLLMITSGTLFWKCSIRQ